jgi:KipI family sensor histidine kinase inhibitor
MRVHSYGDGALYVDLELADAPDRAERTHAVAAALRDGLPEVDVVVGAGSLALVGLGAWDDLEEIVAQAMRAGRGARQPPTVHTIEVVYDGPDLEEVAAMTGLAPAQVGEFHASREYVVELVGFLPGFGYLASLDPRLVVPRRASPRPRVAAGSLAIAGPYTGVYPLASPGGWHVIGRVIDATLFDPERNPPSLFAPGDRVRFFEKPRRGKWRRVSDG